MQSHEMQGETREELGEAVNSSLGLGEEKVIEESSKPENEDFPEAAKKRLGMQEKRHKKEMRQMQRQLEELHMRMNSSHSNQSNQSDMGNYDPMADLDDMDPTIYKAVAKAIHVQKQQEMKQEEERKRKALEQQNQYQVNKHYQTFKSNLESAAEKYEDFDDVVRAEDAPYTDAMRDASLLIDNAPDVLYHLGKDREKLKRISQLHPLEQAKEVIKLSHALAVGNGNKQNTASNAKPLGNVKNNPVTSNSVTDNTSVAEIRKRMKDGGRRWG